MKNLLGGFIYEKKIEKKIFLPGIRIHFNGIPHGNWHNFQFSVQESGFVFVQLQTKVKLCWLKVNPWEVETKGALLKEAGSPNIPAWSLFLLDPREQDFRAEIKGMAAGAALLSLGQLRASGCPCGLWGTECWKIKKLFEVRTSKGSGFWVCHSHLGEKWWKLSYSNLVCEKGNRDWAKHFWCSNWFFMCFTGGKSVIFFFK